MTDGLLLDTHALIWIVHGDAVAGPAREAVISAGRSGVLFVSAATAWEIGFLASKPSLLRIIGQDARAWFSRAIDATGAEIVDLTAALLLDLSVLPEPLHRDPADRMIIATARARDLTLVTRDRAILDYADAGHVRAIAC